ncbi:MAG: hypothetical protein J6N19_08565 [Clostridium sp.]|nr:hypothetical protein [Clostridium sp.]
MSYDISLKDPATKKTIELNEPHFMQGGTYAMGGTKELWLNITYNYSHYYYEATDKDPRFAHDEVSCYYSDGTKGPIETEYGIRGIYGKTGAESIPMLEDMIRRITEKYQKDGEWIETERTKARWYDENGNEVEDPFHMILQGKNVTKEEYTVMVSEGDTDDYWEATAVNAIKPLHQLIAMAKMRPDGVWDGD